MNLTVDLTHFPRTENVYFVEHFTITKKLLEREISGNFDGVVIAER